jgi:hypothetical protein
LGRLQEIRRLMLASELWAKGAAMAKMNPELPSIRGEYVVRTRILGGCPARPGCHQDVTFTPCVCVTV